MHYLVLFLSSILLICATGAAAAPPSKKTFGPTPEREKYIRDTMAPQKAESTTPKSPGNNKESLGYKKVLATCQAVALWQSKSTCPYYCLTHVDATAIHGQFTALRPLNSTIDRWDPTGWDKECLNTTLGYHNCLPTDMGVCVYRRNRRP